MVGLVYGGFTLFAVGCLSMVGPLAGLGLTSRGGSVLLVVSGLLVMMAGLFLPTTEQRSASSDAQLDRCVPVYQVQEFHSIRVNRSADQVYRAIKEVTADEILFFQALTWIHRCRRALPEGILNVPKGLPILDVASRTSFLVLAEKAGQEIVLGTLVVSPADGRNSCAPAEDFRTLCAPGFAVAAINFWVDDDGRGTSLVSTETRVHATDDSARRKFARYWRVIYPGSALIRRMWLRAIKLRAERTPGRVG